MDAPAQRFDQELALAEFRGPQFADCFRWKCARSESGQIRVAEPVCAWDCSSWLRSGFAAISLSHVALIPEAVTGPGKRREQALKRCVKK